MRNVNTYLIGRKGEIELFFYITQYIIYRTKSFLGNENLGKVFTPGERDLRGVRASGAEGLRELTP